MSRARRRFGSVRRLPSGRWQARYPAPGGVLRTAPHTFETKTAATRFLSQVEADLQRGQWIDPNAGMVTVGEWARRWMNAEGSHLKAKTRASYASILRTKVLPAFGNVPLASIRPIMVAEWVSRLDASGLSASQVRQSYRLLSQMMRSAVDNGLIALSPCRGVKVPRLPDTEPRILTVAEVERMAVATRPPHDLLIRLLAYAGLRVGEASLFAAGVSMLAVAGCR